MLVLLSKRVVFVMVQFIKVLQQELDAVEKGKDAFIHDFTQVYIFYALDICPFLVWLIVFTVKRVLCEFTGRLR